MIILYYYISHVIVIKLYAGLNIDELRFSGAGTQGKVSKINIFLTPADEIKLIDTARAMKKKTIYPSLIIKGLEELGYKKQFLRFVEINKPALYAEWLQYCK